MKKFRIFLVCVVVLVLCAGCSSTEVKVAQPTIDHPPYCEAFLKVQGKPLGEVLPALGLKAESFTHDENKPQYILNEPVEFLGYEFEMQLLTQWYGFGPESETVIAACYILKAETPEAGAEIVADLRDKLLKGYGAAYNGRKYYSAIPDIKSTSPPSPLNKYTKEDLLSEFTEGSGGRVRLEWLLSVDLSHIPQQVQFVESYPYTCITATLSGEYPVTDTPENGQTPYVLIQLNYALSHSY